MTLSFEYLQTVGGQNVIIEIANAFLYLVNSAHEVQIHVAIGIEALLVHCTYEYGDDDDAQHNQPQRVCLLCVRKDYKR